MTTLVKVILGAGVALATGAGILLGLKDGEKKATEAINKATNEAFSKRGRFECWFNGTKYTIDLSHMNMTEEQENEYMRIMREKGYDIAKSGA